MTLHIVVPENLDLETIRRLDREAREAVAVSLYRDGTLSHGQFAKYLGIDRAQAEELLGRHAVVDYTATEVRRDFRLLREDLGLSQSRGK
jgi:predicted HTH domain antitoxin